MGRDIRRIVTGLDEKGRSIWTSDELVKPITENKVTGFRITDLWNMAKVPGHVREPDSPVPAGSHGLPGGALFRYVESPPKSVFKDHPDQIPKGPDGKPRDPNHKSTGMHVTDTIDFMAVISGEIYCYLEDEDEPKLLKEGDTLIQAGTYHSWHNRSDKPCIMMFALISAKNAYHKPGEAARH